ncbi:MAG: 4-hydroxy-tetrahydrodipicolinate synthase [Ignavibacteriales bacterium]
MVNNLLPRLMTAMVTPFKTNLEVDFEKAGQLAQYLIENGSQGLVVCGTTGESPTLSKEEKVQLFRSVKDKVGKEIPVWAGIGSNSTDQSVQLAKKAVDAGVDGIMAVTPYYNKPSQEGLYRHFKAIAESVSLPLMLYNVPSRTSINMLPETVKRLSGIDNIVCLKESTGNMDQMSELKSMVPSDFIIYCGDDALTLPMMSLGAHGVVSIASHLIGNDILQMIDSYINGQIQKAQQIHARLFPVFKVLFVTTNPIPIKEALKMRGQDKGLLREPLCEASEGEKESIARVLRDLGLI